MTIDQFTSSTAFLSGLCGDITVVDPVRDEIETQAEAGAAEAFAALQDEIAALGRKIEALANKGLSSDATDYGPSFAEVQRQIETLDGRIAGLADYLAMRLTPDQHARAFERAKEGIFQDTIRQLREEAGAIRWEREALGQISGLAGNRKRQRLWLVGATLAGFLGYPLSAVTLPGGSYLAAITTGKFDRWLAGAGLMQVADPEGARSIARATRIVSANAEAIGACAEAARKAGREQKCVITVEVRAIGSDGGN